MHHQFNIQQLYVLPHSIYVFCIYLRTNSDLCHLHHKLIGFYNREERCLQRGTDWVFKLSGLRFVCKGFYRRLFFGDLFLKFRHLRLNICRPTYTSKSGVCFTSCFVVQNSVDVNYKHFCCSIVKNCIRLNFVSIN